MKASIWAEVWIQQGRGFIWTPYLVHRSNSRVIRSHGGRGTRPNKEVASHLNKDGYLQVTLSYLGESRSYCVHKLVAWSFHGPCPPGMEVNHKDGNKLNNSWRNLEYVTHLENMRHARRNGLYANHEGENNGRAIATEKDVLDILSRRAKGQKRRQIHAAYDGKLSRFIIDDVIYGRSWPHLQLETARAAAA